MMMGRYGAMGAFSLHVLLRWLVVRRRIVCIPERDHVATQRRRLESRRIDRHIRSLIVRDICRLV